MIQNVLIDNHEKTIVNLFVTVLKDIDVDVYRAFGPQTPPKIEIDFDNVVFGLRKGLKEELRGQYFFFDVIPPIAMATAYKKLMDSVRIVHVIHKKAQHEYEIIFVKDLKKLEEEEEVRLEFFSQILDRVHLIGLGSLGLEQSNTPLSFRQLHNWIKRELNL